MLNRAILFCASLLYLSTSSFAQTDTNFHSDVSPLGAIRTVGETGADTVNGAILDLEDCIKYALRHQPALNQSLIDEAIARTNNSIAVSNWLPQVQGTANYIHYFQLPTAFTPLNGQLVAVKTGLNNTSTPAIGVTQNIFSTDALLAIRASRLNTALSKENTKGTKIDLVSDVSKSFYDLLLSIQQIGVYTEDTARLIKNKSDAYHQYVSGIVDKVDFKEASISLNNSMYQLKASTEAVQAKYAILKQFMGYPSDKKFTVRFDTSEMMQDIYVDTTEQLQYEKRIEFQQLMLMRNIQKETTAYYHLNWLPSVSAFYNYDYEYEANKFSDLYSQSYPYSFIGLQLSVPIFTGFRRIENVHKSQLQEKRIDWDEVNLKLAIYSEYKEAMSNYKSNLYNLHEQSDNVGMAREVYEIVRLQYREGIKAYLDVIVAESNLETSEINYLNALFQLLQSKIDLQKAMGDIPTEI